MVLCDYATRYPEAILLPSVTAKNVANALIQVFARVGILMKFSRIRGQISYSWVQRDPLRDNVVGYITQLRERIIRMQDLANENLREAQQHQKVWYDKKPRDRVFLTGDKVLLLLPDRENKLIATVDGKVHIPLWKERGL
ncbi:hypothetical protein FKM82_029772 [Ascaphus truei]